jgi:capsule polysaccharide export protein KpsE/RkpR
MTTFLHVQGADIQLAEDESFNKARHRLNKAQRQLEDYRNGNIDGDSDGQKFDPYHQLSFKTSEGGRVSANVEKVIAITSDEEKDVGGGEE